MTPDPHLEEIRRKALHALSHDIHWSVTLEEDGVLVSECDEPTFILTRDRLKYVEPYETMVALVAYDLNEDEVADWAKQYRQIEGKLKALFI